MKNKPTNPQRQTSPKASTTPKKRIVTERSLRCLPWLWGALFTLVAGAAMLVYESEFLFRVQELNLFLPTSTFLRQYMVLPGGFGSWTGAFLTQFFYYPWLGVLVAALTWWALMFVTRRAFRIPARWSVLMLVPAALLLAAQMDQGYWIYYQKLKGSFFAPTCGTLAALLAVWLYRRLPERFGARLICMVVWTLGGYPLFGAFALVGTLWMALWTWRTKGKTGGKVMDTLMAVLLVVAAPVLWYRFYGQTGLSFIYAAGLPSYHIDALDLNWFKVPFALLFLFPVVPFLIDALPTKSVCEDKSGEGKTTLKRPALFLLGQVVMAVGIGLFINYFWYKDDNFHKELAMNRAIENLDWEGILSVARDETKTPTRLMVQNKNLALFRLGRAGDEMYHYRDGGEKPNAPFKVHMMQVGGKELYLHYGKLNFCYRWCMEDGVEFGWKVYYLKFLTKAALLSGEPKLARKYIDMLKQTLFYRSWAEKYEAYLRNPSKMKSDPEFAPIFHMLTYKDQLDGDATLVEMYLLNSFANGDGDDPVYQEATLIATLNVKKIELFWPRFTKYAILHEGQRMPTHYQEAAYLYGHLEHKVDISKMPFDEEVKRRYADFLSYTSQLQQQYKQANPNLTQEQLNDKLKEDAYSMFGNTFYYFYFLIRGVQSY